MNSRYYLFLSLLLLLPVAVGAQSYRRLQLPNLEQLPSPRVLCVVQDEEGFLWYATEGGGLCCDDGRQMTVFRNDADHPDLLGSNNIASLAVAGNRVLVGTFHGAYVLDKSDYGIRRLEEVDDKRVDDIIVGPEGHWWLTSNRKVYEYAPDGAFLNSYAAGDKYIFRLHADRQGCIWAAEWQGGLLKLVGGRFVPAPWPLDVAPTNIADHPSGEGLLIGTFGKGTVLYHPDAPSLSECSEPADLASAERQQGPMSPSQGGVGETPSREELFCMSMERQDNQGSRLVADGRGGCYVLSAVGPTPWYRGQALSAFAADSLCRARGLSQRPSAFAFDADGRLWFSTGHDIRRQQQVSSPEEVVLSRLADISAMTFAADGTLWLGSIYGVVYTYKGSRLRTDRYASNEFGDALLALQTDSCQRLLLVSERYVRLYDPRRHTLRQQSREAPGTYVVELAETQPYQRWSTPGEHFVVERMPRWLTAWWMWVVYVVAVASLVLLLTHYYILRRQRRRFLDSIRNSVQSAPPSAEGATPPSAPAAVPPLRRREQWLQKAIDLVVQHIDKDDYGVEQLSSDLAMSRMTFYRKIQSVTGQKPSEFIRTIRLRRAAELLRRGERSVTEVSYDTGFSSVSYFSRCFRTMYGVPPTQFGKTTTAAERSPIDEAQCDSGSLRTNTPPNV